MRKFGLIAAIVGVGILGLDLLLKGHVNLSLWAWLPGVLLLSGGSALFVLARWSTGAPVIPAPKPRVPIGSDTARLLDNFEQRFAELKGRKASATVLDDLYSLGTQLEQRSRAVQATAVYRHLARIDNTYRDVAARLKRLMDAERAKPKTPPPPATASAGAPAGASNSAPAAAAKPAAASAPAAKEAPRDADATQRLGRYQLEREIGRGAMGVVYLGRDTAINRLVAIKAIPLASEFSEVELA
ncbi:MAG TPA: hypothetical protein VMQ54_01905, partial [Steroidobacteraceae bacterium]|nr:hypothetical protein [Steroidobacteraceae bacterium]